MTTIIIHVSSIPKMYLSHSCSCHWNFLFYLILFIFCSHLPFSNLNFPTKMSSQMFVISPSISRSLAEVSSSICSSKRMRTSFQIIFVFFFFHSFTKINNFQFASLSAECCRQHYVVFAWKSQRKKTGAERIDHFSTSAVFGCLCVCGQHLTNFVLKSILLSEDIFWQCFEIAWNKVHSVHHTKTICSKRHRSNNIITSVQNWLTFLSHDNVGDANSIHRWLDANDPKSYATRQLVSIVHYD